MTKLSAIASAWTVNNLIGDVSEAGNVRVTFCNSLFNRLIGKNPIVKPVSKATDQNGVIYKKYVLDGITFYSHDVINELGEKKTQFLMNAEDAKAKHVPVATSVATEQFVS